MQDELILKNGSNQNRVGKSTKKYEAIRNIAVGFSSEILFLSCLFLWLALLSALFFFTLFK